MNKKLTIGIIIILIVIIGIILFFSLNSQNTNQCGKFKTLDNSTSTKNIIECYLNNQKNMFISGYPENVPVTEILKGNCSIDEFRNWYTDNKYHQDYNQPCEDCSYQGIEVWFKCSGYQAPLGACIFDIYKNYTFTEIRCPYGV